MKIGVIKADTVIHIHKSRNPWLRAIWALIFIGITYSWWVVFVDHETYDFKAPLFDQPWVTVFIFIPLLAISVWAICSRKRLSDYFLLFITGVTVLNVLLFILVSVGSGGLSLDANPVLLYFFFGGLVFAYRYFWRYFLLFCRTTLRLKRWTVHKVHRKWEGYAKLTRQIRDEEAIALNPVNKSLLQKRKGLFIFCGVPLTLLGLATWSLIPLALFKEGAMAHLSNSEVSSAVDAVLQPGWIFDYEDFDTHIWSNGLVIMILISFGYLSFWLLGFLWDRYRRTLLTGTQEPMSKIITSNDLLYLRTFSKENTFLKRGRRLNSRFIFSAYDWSFTFEELIVEKLRFIGRLFGHGSLEDKNRKMQTPGSYRHYVDDWEGEISTAMERVRLIVMIMGVTESLTDEINEIRDSGYLGKTLFLMPPNQLSKKQARAWEHLSTLVLPGQTDYLTQAGVKVSKLLAVVIEKGRVVFFTGPDSTGKSYDAMLELAGNYMIADELSRKRSQNQVFE